MPTAFSYALALLALAAPAAVGCNLITGASGIVLDRSGDDDEGAVGGWGTSTTTATGGYGSGSGASGGVEDSGSNGGQDPGSGSTGGSGLGAGGTGGAPATDCTWPSGGTGVTPGATLSEWLAWQGYAAYSNAQGIVPVSDYYDCDGSKGIQALLFVSSSWNCGVCQVESSELEGNMAQWAPLGIQVVVLLMQGPFDEPADAQTALSWKSQWGLSSVAVVADPAMKLMVPDAEGVPQQTIVDPRTMQIVDVETGYDGPLPALVDLAVQNASL